MTIIDDFPHLSAKSPPAAVWRHPHIARHGPAFFIFYI